MTRTAETFYNIRQVIDLTGISEFTLRGWESRYHAFEPNRTVTGRRLYSREDILKLFGLKTLITRGFRIGDIAGLNLAELQKLIESHPDGPESRELQNEPAHKLPRKGQRVGLIRKILELTDRYEWDEIQGLIEKKREDLEPPDFIYGFILPLIEQFNRKVGLGQMTVAQEHILSAFIKDNLYAVRVTIRIKSQKPIRLVLATPEGDYHEIGILMASTLAAIHGVKMVYLGPNVPKEDLSETCMRFRATHLLIASTVSKKEGAKEDLHQLIHFLDSQLNPEVTLWVAGRNAYQTPFELKRDSATLESFRAFEKFLMATKRVRGSQ
jgi:methanogenic corrinoid protein MtbC1